MTVHPPGGGAGSALRVGIRVDASPSIGVGHVMRCLALAEELRARGVDVVLLGSIDVGWLDEQVGQRGIGRLPGPDSPKSLVDTAQRHGLTAVVLDSYDLDPGCAGALRRAGVTTLAIIDADTRGQEADLFLDQNFGASLSGHALPSGSEPLAGLPYVLVRDAVRSARPPAPPVGRVATVAAPLRVLCFFGGTDVFGAAITMLPILLATAMPMHATVIAARPELVAPLSAIQPTAAGQSVHILAPTDDLPRIITGADLVVSAAGTSTWDLLCLGAAAALVWVADNQEASYERVVQAGLVAGLGRLDDLVGGDAAADRASEVLAELIGSPESRARLAAHAWHSVDGLGRARVADALLARVSDRLGTDVGGADVGGGAVNR